MRICKGFKLYAFIIDWELMLISVEIEDFYLSFLKNVENSA